MASTDYSRVRELFLRAVELAPADRAEFLERTCGADAALRADVESLLSHHAVDTILATQDASSKTIVASPGEMHLAVPQTIGHGRVSAALFGSPVRRAIALAVLMLSFLGLVAFTHYQIEDALRDVVGQQLSALRDANVVAFEKWVDQRMAAAEAWAVDERVQKLTLELVKTAADRPTAKEQLKGAPAQDELRRLFQPFLQERGSAAYSIIDRTGLVLASNFETGIGTELNSAASAYMVDVFRGRKTRFARPYPEDVWLNDPPEIVYGRPVVWVDTPITDENDEVIASLGFGEFADRDFSDILGVATTGETGETFAFDDRGVLITESRFTDKLREQGLLADDTPSMLNFELKNPSAPGVPNGDDAKNHATKPLTNLVATAIASRNELKEADRKGQITNAYCSYHGSQVIGAWIWLPQHNFGVATETHVFEAARPLIYFEISSGVVLGILGICLVVACFSAATVVRLRAKVGEALQLGQYTLVRPIGEGGMGKVYLARHALLKRPTAIKIIKNESLTASNRVRFEREVQLASLLTHPNTIEIYDYGHSPDNVFYYAMEYLAGYTLLELVAKHGPVPPARAVHILHQICGSLREAHSLGLVHRDIKPRNVMLCCRGGEHDVVKVLDFGLVKPTQGDEQPDLTAADHILGTPMYMAPERFRAPAEVDHHADIFAVGAVAYFLLTGKHAFDAKDMPDVIHRVLQEQPSIPSTIVPGIPQTLDDLVMSCLAKDIGERPHSIQAIIDRLPTVHDGVIWSRDEAADWWRRFGDTETIGLSASWAND